MQNQARRWGRRWPSKFDLFNLTAGTCKEIDLHAHTVQATIAGFVQSRDRHKKRPTWRKASGSKRSLGWIPFPQPNSISLRSAYVVYQRIFYPIWLHRPIQGKIKCGSFNEDSRGRWWINLTCEIEDQTTPIGTEELGIDLGLKDLATLSTGEKLENPRHYRREERNLAKAQRAGRKDRSRAIHQKIKNRRKHDLNVSTYRLIKRSKSIFVGNVSSSKLTQTRMAKSVNDVGWYEFKKQLRYKAIRHAVVFKEIDESYSSQTCSNCGSLPDSRPRGIADLGVRQWDCTDCGAHHGRDVNAARNILLSGLSAGLRETGSSLGLVG